MNAAGWKRAAHSEGVFMIFRSIAIAVSAAWFGMLSAMPAQAQSDLLVAPTRLVLEKDSGGEVVISNKGDSAATYRISLVLRRMENDGRVVAVDEAEASPEEAAAIDILTYAPRRVTLASQESRTIRIGVRAPDTLPQGEYRAHLLFRSIPDAADPVGAANTPASDGMSIQLTPIYGVAIPVIVRVGPVDGEVTITQAKVANRDGRHTIDVELARSGNRSVYGNLAVMRQGSKEPVARIKGIAVYPEIERRTVAIPVDVAGANGAGELTVEFVETDPAGKGQPTSVAVTR